MMSDAWIALAGVALGGVLGFLAGEGHAMLERGLRARSALQAVRIDIQTILADIMLLRSSRARGVAAYELADRTLAVPSFVSRQGEFAPLLSTDDLWSAAGILYKCDLMTIRFGEAREGNDEALAWFDTWEPQLQTVSDLFCTYCDLTPWSRLRHPRVHGGVKVDRDRLRNELEAHYEPPEDS